MRACPGPKPDRRLGATLGVGPVVSAGAEVGTKLLLTPARRARRVGFALSVTVGGVARFVAGFVAADAVLNTQLGAPLSIPLGELDELYLRPEVNYDLSEADGGNSASQVRVGLGIGGRLACGNTDGIRTRLPTCFVELLTVGTVWEDDLLAHNGRLAVPIGSGVAF